MWMLPSALGAFVFVTIVAAQSNQIPLVSQLGDSQFENHKNLPGFDLNLDALRLVQFSLDQEPEWITERQKLAAKTMGFEYMDITETPSLGVTKKLQFSYPPPNSTFITGVFPYLSKVEAKANLEHLTSYYTWYYNSGTGRASSDDDQKSMITVESVKHSWKQNSIIIRMRPVNASESDPITILGAHIDSLNKENPYFGAPGAGDDSSGTVAILKAYRGLLLADYRPVSPLEFHFYAAEEGSLFGSQAIASNYEATGKVVKGMKQFDMTVFHKAGTREQIAVIHNANQVNAELTAYLILIIERHRRSFLSIKHVKEFYPGPPGPSSDHASWFKAGYQTCHSIKGAFKNAKPRKFIKLAVAFAIEMSNY
ncbi:hypothetical protein B0H10DRAFT_2044696 [Mycena sp. CBHHK59/15]|nr:hypothetical protein B0H10DRAFT_2044696 [Mycena sp. CBHHK59/15]